MVTIEVDFDVFKAITLRRMSEEQKDNDVLRDVFGLEPRIRVVADVSAPAAIGESGGWHSKGVWFPEGTEFRARYKGQLHFGRVEGGVLVVNGRRFQSPSSAAVAITGNPVNGWTFWECRRPGESGWTSLRSLR